MLSETQLKLPNALSVLMQLQLSNRLKKIYQNFQVNELFYSLLKRFENRLLENPFQNVRDRIASMLVSIFNTSIQFEDNSTLASAAMLNLIDKIYPKLEILVDDSINLDEEFFSSRVTAISIEDGFSAASPNPDEGKKEKSLRLFKTICRWMQESIMRSFFGGISIFYNVYPIICQFENNENDEELSETCSRTLALLAQSFTLPEHIPAALAAVDKISESSSWSARSSCAEFLQVLVFHNMSTLISNKEWIKQVQNVVLRLLEDENVQVREKAGQILGGLLHCTLLPEQETLLVSFFKINKSKMSQLIL